MVFRSPVSRDAGLFLFVAAATGLFISMLGCDRLFYYPDRVDRGRPSDEGLRYEDVHFTSADGTRLHGWLMPAAPEGPAKGSVLHVHGNAGNVSGHYRAVSWLPPAGYHVLAFDYRGYGRSEGGVSRAGTISDTIAALEYLRLRPETGGAPIYVIGQSIGGAIAIVLCAERRADVAGLVVDSAFTRYRDVAWHHVLRNPALLAVGWWYPLALGHAFDPIDHVGRVSPVPVLFMHGTNDRVVPHAMSEKLFAAAGPPKELWLIEGMDHYEVWSVREEEARRRVLEFFESCRRGASRK